jgi:hypothetical protein
LRRLYKNGYNIGGCNTGAVDTVTPMPDSCLNARVPPKECPNHKTVSNFGVIDCETGKCKKDESGSKDEDEKDESGSKGEDDDDDDDKDGYHRKLHTLRAAE